MEICIAGPRRDEQMTEWGYAQQDPSEELAKLHFFTIKTVQAGQAIEFTITVKEYVTPPLGAMTFFAQADKQTNQRTAPYTPSGWGNSLMSALSACTREIHGFPFEGETLAASA
jgi:hypothetical protein